MSDVVDWEYLVTWVDCVTSNLTADFSTRRSRMTCNVTMELNKRYTNVSDLK